MLWELDLLSTAAIVAVITLVVKFSLLVQTRWKFQRALKDFPSHPRGIYILGHAKAYFDGARGMLSDWDNIYENNEKAMQAWITPFIPGVVCYHPDTIKAIFNTAEPKDWSYRFFVDWLGDGLLLSSGRKWARNRKLLAPAFHFDILKPYVKVFAESSNRLAAKWKELCIDHGPSSIEVMEDISLATLDILMKCIMASEDDVQQMGRNHPYINATYLLTELLSTRFTSLLYQFDIIFALSPDGYKQREALRIAHGFSSRVVSKRRRYLEDDGGQCLQERLLPFLDVLLQAEDEDGKGLSDREIRDEVDTFMFGGHDTVSSGLSWILYNLANHPELQERCRNEVDEVMGGKGNLQDLEWNDLSKLEYLTKFIKESLRLHAPVPGVGRRLESAVQLPDGRVIPKGVGAYCHISGVHRNPNVWKDPLVFDPERFSLANSSKQSPHAFIPFAAGPRRCIGQQFAMAELKTTIAVLLRHFRFAADVNNPVQRINKTILRSTTGIHIVVALRD